jgi:hypothetical protein
MSMFEKYLIIPCSLFIIFTLVSIPLVYADVITFDTDKHTFYVAGETITFSGTTDTAFNQVVIEVREPADENGIKNLVTAQGTIASSDMKFSESVEMTTSKFNRHGIYTAIAYLSTQTAEEGITIFFDFSTDGSPVVPSAHTPPLKLKELNPITINELTKLVFTAALVNPYSGNETLTYSLEDDPPTGATISSSSGSFSWIPTEVQGPGTYTFDIVVKAGAEEDRESVTITVKEVADAPEPEPEPEPEPNVPDFVDPKKGAQYYLDRYKEPAYKAWFDENYPGYTIQDAIELAIPDAFSEPEPEENVPNFIDPKKGAQYYLDRYNNEKSYKAWFDNNYPSYTIEEAIELAIPGTFEEPEPEKEIAPFVDPNQDPQYYIDRYHSEESYKAWFDENFPDQTIYEAVGVKEPKTGICGTGTHFVKGVCVADRQGGGGCLIATAAYGSEMSKQVQFLREMRDNTVLETESGSIFMNAFNSFYYSFSPAIADLERQSPMFKNTVQVAITPMLSSLSLLSIADIDSEEAMLGYGIGVILLNLGMYVVFPAITIIKVRKYIIN